MYEKCIYDVVGNNKKEAISQENIFSIYKHNHNFKYKQNINNKKFKISYLSYY